MLPNDLFHCISSSTFTTILVAILANVSPFLGMMVGVITLPATTACCATITGCLPELRFNRDWRRWRHNSHILYWPEHRMGEFKVGYGVRAKSCRAFPDQFLG
jgi:hypothetical protein